MTYNVFSGTLNPAQSINQSTKAHQYIGIIGFQPEMHVLKLKPSHLN